MLKKNRIQFTTNRKYRIICRNTMNKFHTIMFAGIVSAKTTKGTLLYHIKKDTK
jgi:hypothetical protein